MTLRLATTAAVIAAGFVLAATDLVRAQQCARAEFEAVVEEAAVTLRDMNTKNTPLFQERLRTLKEKRGWSHDEFLKEGRAFVIDERIELYDGKIEELIARINAMGQEGSQAKAPDCALLIELRGHMASLVETMKGKWGYMFQKIDLALWQPQTK